MLHVKILLQMLQENPNDSLGQPYGWLPKA